MHGLSSSTNICTHTHLHTHTFIGSRMSLYSNFLDYENLYDPETNISSYKENKKTIWYIVMFCNTLDLQMLCYTDADILR